MFIDASAIVGILRKEPGYQDLVRRIEDVPGQLYTSPLARQEASVSFARSRSGRHATPSPEVLAECAEVVSGFLNELSVQDIHITGDIGDAAIRAAGEYGRATGHPANLNFGDCCAYACAKAHSLDLIYQGGDFAKTDLA